MTYEEVYNRLTNTDFFSAFAGLYRMRSMLKHFDDPQDTIPTVHVAGTNGKGSVCAILDSVLRCAGYRVGLFTSPFLYNFRERIKVNGEMISEDDLARIGTYVYDYTDKQYAPPNQFELLTIMALLYFREQKCDIIILETGLGGTFDPTNAVSAPVCSVITNIGLDHCAVLGDTIEKIAAAKAGIIKQGRDVCVYPVCPQAEAVITQYALRASAPIHFTDKDEIRDLPPINGFEHFSYRGQELCLSLRGQHQRCNAATAWEAIAVINENGFYISDRDIEDGMRSVQWPGRLEILCKMPLVYYDGGHNPQCASAIADWFRSEDFAGKNISVIAGIVNNKDYRTMLSTYRTFADELRFYRFENQRAIDEAEEEALCEEFSMTRIDNLADACAEFIAKSGKNEVLLITGSLYLAADAKAAVEEGIRRKAEERANKKRNKESHE